MNFNGLSHWEKALLIHCMGKLLIQKLTPDLAILMAIEVQYYF